MKLTVQHVMDATLVISQIIREARPMPQKGKYRLARMHAKLLPEFNTANERRDEMIKAYDCPVMVSPPDRSALSTDDLVPSDKFQVPADKTDEFTAAWKEIADQEIKIELEPIPLASLDLGDDADGAIQANELITLGDLVTE